MFINIDPENDTYWINHPTYQKAKKNEDSGLDIPMQNTVIVPAGIKSFKVNLNFKAEPTHAFMLLPRSSICKTTIRLCNSVGIIDKSYRGNVMAVVDNIGETDVMLQEGACYFQIVSFSGILPMYQIKTVEKDTERGEGGFGSTGAN